MSLQVRQRVRQKACTYRWVGTQPTDGSDRGSWTFFGGVESYFHGVSEFWRFNAMSAARAIFMAKLIIREMDKTFYKT